MPRVDFYGIYHLWKTVYHTIFFFFYFVSTIIVYMEKVLPKWNVMPLVLLPVATAARLFYDALKLVVGPTKRHSFHRCIY